MESPRRVRLRRAVAAAAVVATAGPGAFIGTASADHPPASADHPPAEECRGWAPHPNPYVRIAARDNRFDTHCFEAPANRRFRIYLRNFDTDKHNISIYTADPDQDKKAGQVFKGEAVGGRGSRSEYPPQTDYTIGALAPGEYFFRDDNTPAMNGTIIVPEDD